MFAGAGQEKKCCTNKSADGSKEETTIEVGVGKADAARSETRKNDLMVSGNSVWNRSGDGSFYNGAKFIIGLRGPELVPSVVNKRTLICFEIIRKYE